MTPSPTASGRPPRIRVLVVDDSAFARKVIREVLERSLDFEVVGTARDGLDALEKVHALHPDVVTLDLVMPELDGVGFLRALASLAEQPRVVLVSMSDADSELVVEALRAGAVGLVHKPTALATERLYELGDEVRELVRVAHGARPLSGPLVAEPVPTEAVQPAVDSGRPAPLLVVGTSTGGPQALSSLLSALPGNFPAAIAIALHIPPGYTESLAKRLDRDSALEVCEAREGLAVIPGRAIIARAGFHLTLLAEGNGLVCHLDVSPYTTPHRPSVDVLFESAARVRSGPEVIGLVMSGMGEDGLQGARALHGVGARMLTQDEPSSVVYGMPRSVAEAGLSDRVASLQRIPSVLVEMLRKV